MKTLLLTLAATGSIGFALATPGSAEAAQVHFAVNLGVPVVAQYHAQPRGYYRPQRPAYRYVPPHRHSYGHRHEHRYARDHRWHHGPIHGGQVYGHVPTIKRIYINPRLRPR